MLEHHLYGDTEVEVNEVSSHIDELMQRLPGNVTGMEHEFKVSLLLNKRYASEFYQQINYFRN